jgi:hypothetical protein
VRAEVGSSRLRNSVLPRRSVQLFGRLCFVGVRINWGTARDLIHCKGHIPDVRFRVWLMSGQLEMMHQV